jgi:hypothetical protein
MSAIRTRYHTRSRALPRSVRPRPSTRSLQLVLTEPEPDLPIEPVPPVLLPVQGGVAMTALAETETESESESLARTQSRPSVQPQPQPQPPVLVPVASRDLLAGAARELLAAGSTDDTGLRYARAHLAALRAAAAVLAARARPRGKRSARLRSAWVLLAEVAPELGEWAQFFAAGAAKRAAAEAGLRGVVSEREADDLVRDSEAFLARVARLLGVPHQPLLGGPSAAAS